MTELYWWKKAHMVDGKKVHRMGAMGVVASHGGVRGEAGVLWGPLGFGGLWRAVGAIWGCGCGRLWGAGGVGWAMGASDVLGFNKFALVRAG